MPAALTLRGSDLLVFRQLQRLLHQEDISPWALHSDSVLFFLGAARAYLLGWERLGADLVFTGSAPHPPAPWERGLRHSLYSVLTAPG